MPAYDGSGPKGQGPIGRGLGPCGNGMRRGFGRGFRYLNPIVLSKDEQKKILEHQLNSIELEKQEIEKRLNEMN
jgi:hypothetical protein